MPRVEVMRSTCRQDAHRPARSRSAVHLCVGFLVGRVVQIPSTYTAFEGMNGPAESRGYRPPGVAPRRRRNSVTGCARSASAGASRSTRLPPTPRSASRSFRASSAATSHAGRQESSAGPSFVPTPRRSDSTPDEIAQEFLERFPDPAELSRSVAGKPGPGSASKTSPHKAGDAKLRLKLAESGGASSPGLALAGIWRRCAAVACDGCVLLMIGLMLFIAFNRFWMPFTIAVVAYYGASILLLGNTPGVSLFSRTTQHGRAPRLPAPTTAPEGDSAPPSARRAPAWAKWPAGKSYTVVARIFTNLIRARPFVLITFRRPALARELN